MQPSANKSELGRRNSIRSKGKIGRLSLCHAPEKGLCCLSSMMAYFNGTSSFRRKALTIQFLEHTTTMAFAMFGAPSNTLAVKSINYDSYVLGHLQPSSLCCKSELTWKRQIIRAVAESKTLRTTTGRSIEECEAAVISGNPPPAPPAPAKPQAPPGTPCVSPLPLSRRLRRNRKSAILRTAFQETTISPANFILPLFIHEGEEDAPIGAMPGCSRLGWRHGLVEEVYKARDVGVNSVVLFPKIPDALKSPTGDEAFNENGLVPRAIRLLKDKYPDLVIYTDVALDPYSSDGHDGIVREDGVIMNDETVYQLCRQAVAQARAGADVVSPSDMMDGRVRAIRLALDTEGFQNVSILSYTAKYASAFYGPFREALDSNPRFGDKNTYQMNPANYREALLETSTDEEEGADILMVKPAMPYLDVIRLLRDNSPLPIAAYQVSGEYSMIRAAASLGMLDEKKAMLESLLCIKRAGADVILTYFALQAARYLCADGK